MKRRRHRGTSRDDDHGRDSDVHRRPTPSAGDLRTLCGIFPLPSLLLPSLVLLFVSVHLLILPPQLLAQPLQQDTQTHPRPQRVASQVPTRRLVNEHKIASIRPRRQSKTQESIWQLYFRLMSEGNNDTVSAFQQIRQLFSTLIEPERPRDNVTTTEKAPVTADSGGDDDADGAARSNNETATTTTTEPTPRKISTRELMGIFQRNVFGLGRLFGREFWNAIQQSNKNIETYSREWQDAIRPYVE